ncbi:aminoglycoside phosphotransferase family protein [Psychrobacter cryohalolentis]|uniref:Aminoglycoside phosphotransferase n=1 Tax=Psychrobacter cryohalolentis (strain ATCC BAA-1226 / DSM 17306 / VKM B-2378 / K5) TaxID=335284 RepID=Q1QA29_PSYCK|nr:aminoglycoside phosphotransferase [Psychrobacter cryohalolentis K5]ASE25664.1 aminoglycoside phosphotransferase [Psychrobacter cryohalolentis]
MLFMTEKTITDEQILELAIPAINTPQESLKCWLKQVFENQTFTLESLPGDASARRYHRIQLVAGGTDDTTKTARYIVMDSADEQDAMQQFINVAKLMSQAINVPTLIAQDVTKGFLVLQDFGAVEFAHLLVGATPAQVNDYYQSAMQALVALQQIPVETAKSQHQLPDYDAAMLTREMDLFSEWFIPHIGVTLDTSLWENLKSALIEEIVLQPQVIVHRDYHSRNLMQDQADNTRLGVIDFQDAVIGAHSYDLVSLLRDAYVEWSEAQVTQWIHDFWQLQKRAGLLTADSAEQLEKQVNIMGVQRHLKVLGIFIRLYERDGKSRYLADIPKVMRDFLFELEWLSTKGSARLQQVVLPFNQWIMDTVLPAYQTKFVQQYI